MKVSRNSRKEVTIVEVAAQAGVSIATVSRVINGHERVTPEARRRVELAIRRLRYRPNVHARRLVTQSVDVIGFLLCNRDFLNPFHAGILSGVEAAASRLGHEVLYTTYHYSRDTPPRDLPPPVILKRAGAVGGVIIAGTNYPNLLDAVRASRIPHIVFGNNLVADRAQLRRVRGVFFDDARGAREVVEGLVARGHRRIAFAGDVSQTWWRRRRDAYRDVLRRRGLRPIEFTPPLEEARAYGHAAARHLLALSPRPTAIFAGNDLIAWGVRQFCRQNALRIPADLSLVGFDDLDLAALMDPPLTTVSVPVQAVGRACVEMILELMARPDKKPARRMIPVELIPRASWGPPPLA